MKAVYFIVSPSTAPLSHRKSATARISRDSRGAENSDKGNTLCYFESCLSNLFEEIQKIGSKVSSWLFTASDYMTKRKTPKSRMTMPVGPTVLHVLLLTRQLIIST
jgi:hypothetical protein